MVDMLSWHGEVLVIGKFKGYLQNVLCTMEIMKLTCEGIIQNAMEHDSRLQVHEKIIWVVAFLKLHAVSFKILEETRVYYRNNK